MTKEKGTVKWFNPAKGYGFVEPADRSRDVFIHISAVEQAGLGNLSEGQKIGYNTESKNNKISAINIELM